MKERRLENKYSPLLKTRLTHISPAYQLDTLEVGNNLLLVYYLYLGDTYDAYRRIKGNYNPYYIHTFAICTNTALHKQKDSRFKTAKGVSRTKRVRYM